MLKWFEHVYSYEHGQVKPIVTYLMAQKVSFFELCYILLCMYVQSISCLPDLRFKPRFMLVTVQAQRILRAKYRYTSWTSLTLTSSSSHHHHHFIRKSSKVHQSSEQFNKIMSKTRQAHISAYGSLSDRPRS